MKKLIVAALFFASLGYARSILGSHFNLLSRMLTNVSMAVLRQAYQQIQILEFYLMVP